jgi:hypothetical protein
MAMAKMLTDTASKPETEVIRLKPYLQDAFNLSTDSIFVA